MGDFAKITNAKFEEGYIRFSWGTGESLRIYEISEEALRQVFSAHDDTGSGLLDAFEKGREQIIRAAEESRNTPTDGIIELGSGDFEVNNDMTPP
ncbi:DUF1488 family protein [Pusillimonas sp. ANT_WB101]|uniref:DUF1488 family protein n=1 Tax=Pusillimonas sp. ANT_WB101 TaxID=2597356 RepID=UPI0011EDD459|nr:DUF1488 family protein [Pusillimonas sp. ANT_WB101]KAA0892952.1 DUF1488 domain-containing protein [Pusillimonas sp. ANT_WB101]